MITWVESTRGSQWNDRSTQVRRLRQPSTRKANITLTGRSLQVLRGFGGCFNEIGWLPMQSLDSESREEIMRTLFSPDECNFVYNRAPIGANDFAAGWYSYDEVPGDFELEHFSVGHDDSCIIPYIRNAQRYQPDLTLHVSPWSPPTWMKYPAVYNYGRIAMEPENLASYALYFVRYVEEYAKRGIRVSQVFPQNEVWSDAKYPSCTWKSEDLRIFIRDYLGPVFEQAGLLQGTNPIVNEAFGEGSVVEIWLGTLNGPRDAAFVSLYGIDVENYNRYVDNILFDDKARQYISGVGYQWEGQHCVSRTKKDWPELEIIQTESECGTGDNSWEYAEYIFHLINKYFTEGATAYTYWNMVLGGTESTWGWRQNSLYTVDEAAHTFRRNPEYYVLKHYSHFIKPGARLLEVQGRCSSQASAYENPDGSVVVVAQNALEREMQFSFDTSAFGHNAHDGTKSNYVATLKPRSFNSFLIANASDGR
ncbi:MAG: glycosyl hydrolase [Bifidobacteriaceae bacterium]|jgi:glucosylceramidase|nr:glycosyl hydrolase [Bifidobacteriaceae bacterium]